MLHNPSSVLLKRQIMHTMCYRCAGHALLFQLSSFLSGQRGWEQDCVGAGSATHTCNVYGAYALPCSPGCTQDSAPAACTDTSIHTRQGAHLRRARRSTEPLLPLLLGPSSCSWGAAAGGRLGTAMFEDAPFPELLPDIDGDVIEDVACGLDHTLVLIRV